MKPRFAVAPAGMAADRIDLELAGKKAFDEPWTKRRHTLDEMMEVLSANERAQMTRLAEKLVRQLTNDRASGDFICRFCEIESCPEDRCPMHRKVLRTEVVK